MPRDLLIPTEHRRRRGTALVAAALLGTAGGCQSYQPKPLDLPAHGAAFLARTPDSPDVRSFAETLASRSSAANAPSATFDPADGLTCSEAEVIALVYNADLRLARLRAGVARATAANSGLWEDPTLGVNLARIVQSTPEPWKVFTNLGITLPISGRLAIEQQRADAQYAAELARLAEREWSVRMSVRRAWCEWIALDDQLAAGRDFITRVDQVLAVVDQMERAGEIARTEARLFRIEKSTKASELALLEAETAHANLRLRRLMGLSPDAPLHFQAVGGGPVRSDRANDALATDLENRSPSILVAKAEYQAAETALALEIRKQYPDLHLAPGYGREDGQDQILLGLSMPLPILNANRRAVAEAQANRDLARTAAETTLERVTSDLRAARVRVAAAARRRTTLETEIVPLVDAQYTDAREVARLGEVNTLVLLESLKRQHEAKLALVAAVRDESLADIDLEELLGPAAATLAHTADTHNNASADHKQGTP